MKIDGGQLANFADQNIFPVDWENCDDLLPALIKSLPKSFRQAFLPILDAEHELVAIVPKGKEKVLCEIVNRFQPDSEGDDVRVVAHE